MRTFIVAILVAGACFLIGWQGGKFLPLIVSVGAPEKPACAFSLAGSNTLGEKLAPAVVRGYFEAEGFTVSELAAVAAEVVRLRAEGAEETCVVEIRSHGSSYAFDELAAGTAEIGMSSRAIKDGEVERLRTAGAGDFIADAGLAEHVVALDGIAIITNPSNNVASLSKSQVRDAFTAKARDWRALGGASGAITRYARDEKSGTYQFFLEHVLQDDPAWNASKGEARRYSSSSQLVADVARDARAIGFVGMAYLNENVRALPISDGGPAIDASEANVRAESYPISRRLYLYARPETMREAPRIAELVAFFKSEQAYAIVEAQGYVPLRAVTHSGPAITQSACAAEAPEAEVYRVATAGAERLGAVIRFMPGSNAVDSLARDDVERASGAIREAIAGGRTVRLIGHSDAEGDATVNRRLALQRAQTIREAFETRGLMGLQVESAGEACPIADNGTAQGRQSNRRVEIWISAGGA